VILSSETASLAVKIGYRIKNKQRGLKNEWTSEFPPLGADHLTLEGGGG